MVNISEYTIMQHNNIANWPEPFWCYYENVEIKTQKDINMRKKTNCQYSVDVTRLQQDTLWIYRTYL